MQHPRIVKLKQIVEKVTGPTQGDKLGQDAPRSSNAEAPAQPPSGGWTGPHITAGTGNGSEKSPREYVNVY
jgi:hypothetical protein